MKVYQKLVEENLLSGRTAEQIKNKVGKLHETYLQKKKKTNSTGKGSVNWIWFSKIEEILLSSKAVNPGYVVDSSLILDSSDNEDFKENHKSKKKKRKKSGVENLSEVIATMGESRNRFYERKLDLKERESQRKLDLEEKESQKRFDLEEKKLKHQYELEKHKLEIEKLRAENEKVKLELEMLKVKQ